MQDETYTEDLEELMQDIGIYTDSEALSKEDLLENHKMLIRTIKLLLISENIDIKKLEQATDLAAGMR